MNVLTNLNTTAARKVLMARRAADGGWGYRRGSDSAAEPTVLAGLALLATDPESDRELAGESSVLQEAADWLASLQRPDGSVAVSASIPTPGWMTPYALLLWTALGVHPAPTRAGADWLLGQKGRTLDKSDDPKKIAGHDTTLIGWPWVNDTHSWLEPTALAVLALGRVGRSDHPRVREGVRLILDRATEPGGWNYGNKAVFGHPLRAQPAPTGLALLALEGLVPRSKVIDGAIHYLHSALPGVRASASLGWGLVGLRAWEEAPDDAVGWVDETIVRVASRADAVPKLACLLLASGSRTLELFGRSLGTSAIATQLRIDKEASDAGRTAFP